MSERPDPNEVTIGEVYRLSVRIDGRLDQMARDMVGRQEYEADYEANAATVADIRLKLDAERIEREAGDRRILESLTTARRWAIIAGLTAVGVLLGVLTFILDLGGGPA